MVALDARTGRLLWETPVGDPRKGHFATSGSIVINGKVLQGLSGCARFNGQGCWISAVDIATGKLAWKFNTIAQEGTPGGDTWGKQPNMFRAGGETWIAGSYDPESESHLLGHRASQAVGAGQPRPDGVSTRRCTPDRRWR